LYLLDINIFPFIEKNNTTIGKKNGAKLAGFLLSNSIYKTSGPFEKIHLCAAQG
jgi:hypothetical protein